MAKTILITGGNGFLAGHLIDRILKDCDNVELLVLTRVNSDRKRIFCKSNKVKCFSVDLDKNKLARSCLKSVGDIDVCVHLAGYIPLSSDSEHDNPRECFLSNLSGTMNLVNALGKKIKHFIFSSTIDVYGDYSQQKITETSSTNPETFYASSKLAAENYLRVHSKNNQIPVSILRFSHIYGPREKSKKVISIFLKSSIEDKKIHVKNADVRRDFIYIDDAVDSIIRAIDFKSNEIFNIGSGSSTSIADLAQAVSRISKKKQVRSKKQLLKARSKQFHFDIGKAKKYLDFAPRVSLESGLVKKREDMIVDMMNQDNCIFLDLDGVILDNSSKHYRVHSSVIKILLNTKSKLSLEEYWKLKRECIDTKTILSKEGVSLRLLKSYKKLFMKLIENRKVLKNDKLVSPQIQKALERLAEKNRLFLITLRRNKHNTKAQLYDLGLMKHFKKVIIGDKYIDPIKQKSDLLNKHKLKRKLNYLVGDTEVDVLAAKRSGVISVSVNSGVRNIEYLKSCGTDACIERLDTLFVE